MGDLIMVKQIEKEIKELQKELENLQKEKSALRLQPCRGDKELRDKEEAIDQIDKKIEVINIQIRELEKKRRELMSEAVKKEGYESPFG